MSCISPMLVKNSKTRTFVPCGKCNFCLQQKRGDWSFRLGQELKLSNTARFLTLTYDDDHLHFSPSGKPELCRDDIQLFSKRLRKANSEVTDWPIRYYTVGEYGTRTLRPHYHSIMFNLHPRVEQKLLDIWKFGHCHVGEVTPASIHYVTKYVINRTQDYGDRAPPAAYMSRRPGIGSNYLKTHFNWHRAGMRTFTQVNGQLGRLPRYYKEKIFNSQERSRMAGSQIREADVRYFEEVDRLESFHSDPYYYYDESTRHAHDAIVSKVNILNTF